MATKKKADKPAAAKKPVVKKKEIKDIYTGSMHVYTGDLQAWERGEAIKCSANESE